MQTNCTPVSNSPENYRTSYNISWGLVCLSIIAYFIICFFYFPVPESLEKMFQNQILLKRILWLFKPVIYPVTYFVRFVRAETNPNSFGKNQRFEECRRLWNIIRRVELGVENTGVLILQLWLFGPYFALVNTWSWKETFRHLWSGLGHIGKGNRNVFSNHD